MTKHLSTLVLAVAMAATSPSAVRAQLPTALPAPPGVPAPQAKDPVPVLLKVQVVISRYQGEKRISSQPYMMTVSANGTRANLRMALQVPVPSTSTDGKSAVNYRDVGTSIDCGARILDDGRFRLDISIEDSSLALDDQAPQPFAQGIPQFRSFRLSNETAVLRDGQSAQLTTATEKVSGEIAKVDVTLNVVK